MAKLSFVTLIYLCSGILFQAAALPKIHSRHSHPTHEPQLDNTCGNPPSPVEIYLGTAARLRKEDSQDRVKRQTVNPDDPYSCDENKPCSNRACCGKNGVCGYGPDYCGTNGESPNDKCWSNCDAHAPCGEYAETANATCPLNVCCSKFGFCGVTDEFCQDGCQSNCEQPSGSGKSGGDVQSRIIGYYEGWKYDSDCSGVSLRNLPVGSLTHLHLSFGYITPGDFDIVMMPGVPDDVIDQIMELKYVNPGVKILISLGGWTFSDNGTDTQPVFGDIVANEGNRLKFITNLLAFMNQHGFDGVDFDWEYPGAGDRGGNEDDGKNFTDFLFTLWVVNLLQAKHYLVSFTTPTSFWYLQHFDLAASMKWVDWTNLMAYDLHGTWDSDKDQVGQIVLAHTNLTEINTALSLFWRNDIEPSKINLGIGFYGRSFQLTDPGCWKPGCPFKGGAEAGKCSGQSGILSYDEITRIIKQNDIDPYWDKDNAVKYLTWGKDQWVSYDDRDTFQQKIEYANGQGLGGLLIWAIDQDTSDLDAMQGLLYPKTLNAFANEIVDVAYWDEANPGVCRLSNCGEKCKAGELTISTQTCDGSYDADSVNHLCCPVASAPNPADCLWRGGDPYCNGHCQPDEVPMMQNKWGDSGKRCKDGNKVYCCKPSKETGCRTTGCGGSCNSNEVSMAGYFYDDCWFDPKQLCCEKPLNFKEDSCYWQGKGGSCYDNNCKFGTEVQLAESYDGGGDDCGWQLSRQRVFCCEPVDGNSLFLPVPLDYLFKNPPTGDEVGVKFKLDVDDTYGGRVTQGTQDDPNDASFGFVVLASPEAIQVSVDKRDGSHWDVFGCNDAVTEGEHTVQMVCTDDSEMSNCYKIGLGRGVPGTILEMPEGCGPGRYAVAKDMKPSENQTVPAHVAKRSKIANPLVFDLTFDYDFTRVPRDLGDTQIRIDYSNEEGYWNEIVNKTGEKRKAKRSLEDFGGNHRRWLEDAWRQDHKSGLMSRAELHERWFGSDIVSWLKGLFSVADKAPLIDHSVSQTIKAILLQEQFQCNLNGIDIQANLDVIADLTAKIDTQFGLTIIATLTGGSILPDLSQSFMYLRNRGDIDAIFTIDAIVRAAYDTGDIELFGLQNFNALFSVPGIITVGPNFKLFGSVNVELSVSGHLEASVKLAKWDTRITFPDQGSDYDPKSLNDDTDPDTQAGKTDFDWSVEASGQITAHVKPQVSFGITWGSIFNKVPNCEVDLVVDGYATAYLRANAGKSGGSVCYGANVGASLYAQLDAPKQLSWVLPHSPWFLGEWGPVPAIEETCPISSKRDLLNAPRRTRSLGNTLSIASLGERSLGLSKRDTTVIGPLLHLPFGLACPTDDGTEPGDVPPCPLCGDSSLERRQDIQFEGQANYSYAATIQPRAGSCAYLPYAEEACPSGLSTRDLVNDTIYAELLARGELWKRDRKTYGWTTVGGLTIDLKSDTFPTCGEAVKSTKYSAIEKYLGYDASQVPATAPCVPDMILNDGTEPYFDQADYVTEHVFEFQTILSFMQWLGSIGTAPSSALPAGYTKPSKAWVEEYLLGSDPAGSAYFSLSNARLGNVAAGDDFFWRHCMHGLGDGTNVNELILADGKMNGQKTTLFQQKNPSVDQGDEDTTMVYVKYVAAVFTYLQWVPTGGTGEATWNKMQRPSNWIDLVCSIFDDEYATERGNTAVAGEPTYTDGNGNVRQGKMRWLWKAFIDASLNTVERNGQSYCTAAGKLFLTTQSNPNPKYGTANNQIWATVAFGPGGWCNNPRLPRPGGTFGMYGNTARTIDKSGNQVNLGQPTA